MTKAFTRAGILFFVALVFFVGCTANPSQKEMDVSTEKVNLYYGDSNNEKLVTEEREVSFSPEADKYKIILEELIKGPEDKNLRANISPNTKVFGTIKQGNDLIVDFSRDFNQFGGSVAEIISVASVVNTMTQLDNINRVKILVEGQELIGPSGEPRGFMASFGDTQETTTDVVLYFGNKDATKVIGETRKIPGSADENRDGFIKKVLEKLIAGPQRSDLYRTIPKEVKVQSVEITDGTAFIDFSQEMHTKHWGGSAGESMTINSVANTLTEFDFIKRVKMTVNKEPLAIENTILEEPVERNESIIER
ncbi:GerMN domain-containing protein [Candidatus Formimonas warabiya]|uniref:GerMN domain-containing protein n=1 Tax=Formimonas warabiya TaxID=1761012 RepID=A0A3G1KN38_FORW1|nr:GerMN domain-containing protein [Candidatus Formimonas warabiya]ATW23911.1 hypothetical protein DCMF_03060 [Candidatus Formimonas warabiya]